MGQSSDGILFYGFPVDDSSKNHDRIQRGPNDDDEFYIEDLWAKVFGVNPDDIFEFQEKYPIVIGHHCSDECTMYYVAIKKSEVKANRGGPEKVKTLTVDPKWDDQIREFCTKMGFKPPKKFGWFLTSYLG